MGVKHDVLMSSKAIGPLVLKNRLVMPPMCMYEAEEGFVGDFHLAHYGTRALGGVAAVIVESTAILPEGCITAGDLGIWSDAFVPGLKALSKTIEQYGAIPAIQLNHAGRKSERIDLDSVAPSAINYGEGYQTPLALSTNEIEAIIIAFESAFDRAVASGFKWVEIHAAHGYLLHQFLSPHSNQRTDEWGVTLEGRMKLVSTVLSRLRKRCPDHVALSVRISAVDYGENRLTLEQTIEMASRIEPYIDAIHVSTGGNDGDIQHISSYPGYQLSHALAIKKEVECSVIAVGKLESPALLEYALENEYCDFVALGRGLIKEPYYLYQHGMLSSKTQKLPKGYVGIL